MLKILPIQSKLTQEELCLKCSVEYNPDAMAYWASDDDELVCLCQFKVTDKGGYIFDLVCPQTETSKDAILLTVRATLNFISLSGINTALFLGKVKDENLLKELGFEKNSEGIYSITLDKFYNKK